MDGMIPNDFLSQKTTIVVASDGLTSPPIGWLRGVGTNQQKLWENTKHDFHTPLLTSWRPVAEM